LNKSKVQIAEEDFGPASSKILAAYACFDEGFRHFPFDRNHGLYVAPMNFGPANLLFDRPTGYRSTMLGFPYDDLVNWRDRYPENIYEEEFRILCEFWKTGLDMLHDAKAQITQEHQDAYADLTSVAEASYCHFRSTYLQIKFVRLRNNGEDNKTELRRILEEELRIAQKMMMLQDADSRLGYEASNHYYYTHQTLLEKMLNCNYLLENFVADVEPAQ
jgi:hypothetical protein